MSQRRSRSSEGAYRRELLRAVAALGTVGLAGCGDGGSDGTEAETATAGDATQTDVGPTASPTPTATPMPTPTATETPLDLATPPRDPPDGATVLFGNGVEGLEQWQGPGGGDAPWIVEDDYFEIDPGAGSIATVDPIGDCHLHLEFTVPEEHAGDTSGNSGVFMMGRYEFQVLDNTTVGEPNAGMAGTYYRQSPPLAEPARSSTQWQTFDIIWRAPRFEEGEVAVPARATMFFNGVVTNAHVNVAGATTGEGPGGYAPHDPELPLELQDHSEPVRFRNVWYRSLPEEQTGEYQPTYDATDERSGHPHQQAEYPIRYPNEIERIDPGDRLGDPPSDATILLSGGDLRKWVGPDGGSPGWNEEDGYVAVDPGAGNIHSEDSFGDSQIHVEYRIPEDGSGQGESGVLLANRYEIKLRDASDDVDPVNQPGAYTGQAPPLANPSRSRGEWQSLDVVWEGPRFGDSGTVLIRPARTTVLLNGVVVQHRYYIGSPNADGSPPTYRKHDPDQPIGLRENGDPVHYRNVWYRTLE